MTRVLSVFLPVVLTATALPLAAISVVPSNVDPPIVSWQPPTTWSAPAGGRTGYAEIGFGPAPFFPITPCRQYDSRTATALPDNTPRSVTVTGVPCNVPANTNAIAVNITIFSITGAGSNGVFKVGTASPPTTAWINYPPTETQRGNAGVVATDGTSIWVQVNQGAGSLHFTVDVYGYYYNGVNTLSLSQSFGVTGNFPGGGVLWGVNESVSGIVALGVMGQTLSTGAGSAGVEGDAFAASGAVYGVRGFSTASSDTGAAGVYGQAGTGMGVEGVSSGGNGVFGTTSAGGIAGVLGINTAAAAGSHGVGGFAGGAAKVYGVQGQVGSGVAAGSGGLHGIAPSAGAGAVHGVIGDTASAALDSAGVLGRTDTPLNNTSTGYAVAGVRGESGGTVLRVGVLGVANNVGVVGSHHNGAGVDDAQGLIGFNPGTAYGVYASLGTIGCNGCAKQFVDPHPTDPSKTIHYVSLEGPEAGTYFRGTARTLHGRAVIDVPEHFRSVTDEEGLTVQLTSVGEAAGLYVESEDLRQIVVRSSKDVTFHYLVQGIRPAYRNFQPVVDGREYAPADPGAKMPAGWTEWARQRLIQNGTYNPDGTVNMATAERLGWAQRWRDEEKARADAAPRVLNPATPAQGTNGQ